MKHRFDYKVNIQDIHKFPEIPFSKLLSEKILPFDGPATMSGDQEAYSDGILLLSSDLIVLFANQQALKLLGSLQKILIGKKLEIPDLEGKVSLLHEVTIEDSERIIELRTNNITLNKKDYILAILQDITSHFESMERLHFAIEATRLGLWDHNFGTNSTAVNAYYATILGYTFEEFETSNWINLVHPIDLEHVWDEWNKHIAGEAPYYLVDYRVRTKCGKWKWVSARGLVKGYDEKGNPLHLIGSHQDITSQKQAQRELQLQYNVNAISNEFIPLGQKLEKQLDKIIPVLIADKGLVHLSNQEGDFDLSASMAFSVKEIYFIEQVSREMLVTTPIETKILVSGQVSDQEQGFLDAASATIAAIYPLRVREQLMGVLTIFWIKPQPFTDLDDHIAWVAAKQLAESIEREYLRRTAKNAFLNEERKRLARELHDSLSQSLYSVLLTADGGQDFARRGDTEKTVYIFKNIKDTMQQALKEMRLLVYELRPSIISQEGLHQALQHRLESVEKRAGLSAVLENNLTSILPVHFEAQLYGIAQESLNNVLKHSGANSVTIILNQEEKHLVMEIIDDGHGFDYDGQVSRGFGLLNMKERAEQIGGSVDIISKPGQGTRIIARIPLIESLISEK